MAYYILENGKLSHQKGFFVPHKKRDSASHLIPDLNDNRKILAILIKSLFYPPEFFYLSVIRYC